MKSATREELERWRKQITIVQPKETLNEIARHLQNQMPGAYLRFGDGDVRLLAGADDALQKQSAPLTVEMHEAFLLDGPGILKALVLDCPTLGLQAGMQPLLFGISDSMAVNMLWHAGRYFVGRKVYPHSALAYLSVFDPQAAVEFLATLKASRPLFVGNEYTVPDLVQLLFGHAGHIPTPSRDAYEQIDRIEADVRRFLRWDRDYPVVVLGMGCAGRPLAKRLIKSGFKGFIFDFGSLIDALSGATTRDWIRLAPRDPRQVLTMEWPKKPPPAPYVKRTNGASPPDVEFCIRWEGPQLLHHSFAVVNRELCIQLARDPRVDLTLIPAWPHQFTPDADPRFRLIHERLFQPLSRPADVTVRHLPWPDFDPPRDGHWIVVKPWEYPILPPEWRPYMQDQVDEVWVHSRHVRDCYVRGGLPAELLQYIPLGVNVETYRPGAEPARLETNKKFKFLFVGGTLWRKGTDILLRAYHKAFTRKDDVCLVIKDFGKKTFYVGDAYNKLMAKLQKRADAPEVSYTDSFLSDRELAGLYTACDCLVHPYRAEGFGLPIAEAMASGLPAIVTGYGPALDFVTDRVGYMLPFKIAHVKKRWPGMKGRKVDLEFAEPDEDALIEQMRYVVSHPDEAGAKGEAASESIHANWTWERAAQAVMQRFEALKTLPVRRQSKS